MFLNTTRTKIITPNQYDVDSNQALSWKFHNCLGFWFVKVRDYLNLSEILGRLKSD